MKPLNNFFLLFMLITFNCLYAQETVEQNLKKEIIKEGKGDSPKNGNEVKIKFEGRLENGDIFEAATFKFVVGDKEMIKGWNLALPTMKVGEKARFTMGSELGYGDKGVKDEDEVVIPPNATLIFDIELISFK